MKKTIVLILLILFASGCNYSKTELSDPHKVVKEYIEERQDGSEILSQLTKDDFHIVLIEKEKIESIIIFRNDGTKYKYFGETSYNSDKDEYGSYEFKQENNMVIVYSKNEDKQFNNLELKYKNINNDEEILTINDKIKCSNFIKMYTLTRDYTNVSVQLN